MTVLLSWIQHLFYYKLCYTGRARELPALHSNEKQYANQLRIDIPKWKQWLSPQSWEEFLLSGLDKLGGTSQEIS